MLMRRGRTSPVMVGRERELADLRRLLEEAAETGVPSGALIVGEAGVGKSRLLGELVKSSRTLTALVGHARNENAAAPFSLLRAVVDASVADWKDTPAGLAPLAHPLTHLLAPWLTLADHPDDGHEHSADELALAGVALVRHLVAQGPAVVAFEDLHWADAESLMVLRRLATTHRLPALLVATFRPEDLDRRRQLAGLLSDFDHHRSASHVILEPLTPAELRQLLTNLTATPVSDSFADLLHERTRGNPFFVEELVAAASNRDREGCAGPDLASVLQAPLPWTAAEAVIGRLNELDEETRRVLHVAAVLGQRVSLDVLVTVTGRDEAAVVEALVSLVARGYLVEGRPDEFGFRHALTREAVTSRLLTRQRQTIHARALHALLETTDPDPHVLTIHADGAGDSDTARKYARVSAEQALRNGAPRSASRVARLGLSHGEDMALRSVLARACAELGQMADAAEHARRWASAAAHRGQPAEESAANRLLAWAEWSRGDRATAWEALADADSAAAASGDRTSEAWVAAVRAQLLVMAGHAPEAFPDADRALQLAGRTRNRRLRAHAMVTKGAAILDTNADLQPEKLEEAVALLERGRAEAEAVGDIHTLTRALNNRIFPNEGTVPPGGSRALIDDARDVIARYGTERFAAKLASIEAYIAILEGDAQAARRALAESTRPLAPMDACFAMALEAFLEVEVGDLEHGQQLIDDHRSAFDELEAEAHIDFALAEAALAAATSDAQLGHAALSRAGAAVPEVPAGSAVTWWEVAVCALQAGTDPGTVEQARAARAPTETKRAAAARAHLSGALAASRGEHDEAVAAFRRACEDSCAPRPAALRADAEAGLAELLGRAGRLQEARQHAAAADELLHRWPGWRRKSVEALRRRLGDTDSPPHELLTPREREVCVLLARGFSNGEIAGELFISTKTASVHVSNILAKTGLHRRAQVAAWALQAGLAEPEP